MNIAFCVESSFEKGMGHLFRSTRLAKEFQIARPDIKIKFFINNDRASIDLLRDGGFDFCIIDFKDEFWEESVLENEKLDVWINDRHDTGEHHTLKLRKSVPRIVTFDDRGSGASLVDVHIAPLIFNEELKGAKVFSGKDYIVIDKSFQRYKRSRDHLKTILVALGGSDNHKISSIVLEKISNLDFTISVLLGPLNNQKKFVSENFPNIKIIENVSNVGEVFYNFDLLISGGGMMPFEALSTGLPVICCASEPFEIPVCKYIESQGYGRFAGFREDVRSYDFKLHLDSLKHELIRMSKLAREDINFNASSNILKEIL